MYTAEVRVCTLCGMVVGVVNLVSHELGVAPGIAYKALSPGGIRMQDGDWVRVIMA